MDSALNRLNPRQRKFVELVAGGLPASHAYREAGYRATTDRVAEANGCRMMRHDSVAAALAEIQGTSRDIADRAERQRFWTTLMRDNTEDPRVRLKASELLGKAGADFVLRHEHTGAVPVQIVRPDPVDE